MINFKFFACEPRVYYPLRNPYYIDCGHMYNKSLVHFQLCGLESKGNISRQDMDALERNSDLVLKGGIVVFIALAHNRLNRLHRDVEEEAPVFIYLNKGFLVSLAIYSYYQLPYRDDLTYQSMLLLLIASSEPI